MRRIYLFLFVLSFCFADNLLAQIPGKEKVISSKAGLTVAEIMSKANRVVKRYERPERELPNRRRNPQNPLSPEVSAIGNGVAVSNRTTSTNTAQTVDPVLNFNGVTGPAETGAFPPDDMGAIGPTQYILFVNGRIRTFNKTTGAADGVLNINPDVFFSSVMTAAPVNFTSDPRIRYDRFSGKWILIIIDIPSSSSASIGDMANKVLIAYSNTSTITAATVFTFTSFLGGAGKFTDYPTLGVDKNALYIGGNMFSPATGSFTGCDVFVINRTNLLSGGAYSVFTFAGVVPTGASDGPFTPQGVDNPDPAPAEGYFIGVSNTVFGQLVMRRISNPAGVPTISANILIVVPTTRFPINVDHLGDLNGTTGNLDALDDRLFAAMARNGKLWTAHNIAVNASGVASSTDAQRRTGVRWYELQNLTGTPTIVQSGTIFDAAATVAAAKQYFIPSVMVSGQGHAAFSLTTAGTPFRSNAETAGRLTIDGLGTTQAPVTITSSSTAYNPSGDPGNPARRWGDYSYVSLDPLDDMTMWMVNQYCNGTNTYGCRVTKLLAPVPATPAGCSPASTATGQASVNIVLTGTAVNGSGFYDPGANLPAPALPFNHISATVSGGVTVNSVTYTDPTHITLNLNTTAATAGTQTITVKNPDGQSVTSATGILTTTSAGTFTITATAGANGTISPSGAVSVGSGANQSFTITPASCYQIATVLVDGVNNPGAVSTGTYTFTNVTANHTIDATFSLRTYNITASSGANGTVTPPGATAVNCGSNQTYTITPNACYQIASVLVDGVNNPGAVSTGSFTFTNVTATHTISATFSLRTYNITASSGANGTVSPPGATAVNCGSNQTYTITPNACYQIATVLVDGVNNPGAVSTGSFTFTNVTAAHTISATFSLLTYNITASSGANGTVSPPGATAVNCGSNQAYTITPNACYQIATVLVDGVNNPGAVSTGSFTFTNVTAAHTISATFSLRTFTITASAGANGSISPNGAVAVNCGANQAFTITPNAGFAVQTVLVDGVSQGAITNYNFTNVTTAHTISATFTTAAFTITSSAGANGSISPSGAVSVASGANQTFTITPNACYQIATVLVDGVNNPGAVSSGSFTFSNVTANHTISATFNLSTYTITASAGVNGSISPTGAVSVNCGSNQTFTITPNACYQIATVLVDGVNNPAAVASGTFSFTNVTANHTISATFSLSTFAITASAGVNGTISPNGTVNVNCGASQVFTITPNACYQIATVLVDGVNNPGAVSSGSFTFTNVTAAHTISATFSLRTFTITASAGANGSISPNGAVAVNCGANQAFTITPNAGFAVQTVLVDGVSQGAITNYNFTNVTTAHTISATFTTAAFTITSSAGANGSISPSGAVSVASGANQTFTITPNACYQIATVLVDGVNNPGAVSSGSFTFSNVTANHTISATFNLSTYTITASAGVNGSISPNGAIAINCGASQTFTITPATCYQITSVLVDGVNNPGAVSSGSFTFSNVTANHTISATFSLRTFTITASAGANGSISPNGAVAVNCGANQSFSITPGAGFVVQNVLVDGSSVGAVTTYLFSNVTAGHTISATFSATGCTPPTLLNSGGIVLNASCGQNNGNISIIPTSGTGPFQYSIDGGATYVAGPNGGYTFTNLAAGTYQLRLKAGNGCESDIVTKVVATTTYTINASAGANGSIGPNGAVVVNCGFNQTFNITPDAGFGVQNVLVDGVSVGAPTTYTFTNVNDNHTISATFVSIGVITYNIAASAGANGSIAPNGSVVVNSGANQTFTISPNACYQRTTVLVDGVNNAAAVASGTFTFTNVTANHTISATFSQLSYTINASAGANGSISPNGAVVVGCGANQTFNVIPNGGFSVQNVVVDGISQGPVTSYIFSNVTTNHTISATFGPGGCNTPTFLNSGAIVLNASCGNSDGNISIIPTSGTPPFDYSIDGGTSYIAGPNGGYTFGNLAAGVYQLRLMGAGGCESAVVSKSVGQNCPAPPVTRYSKAGNTGNTGNQEVVFILPNPNNGHFMVRLQHFSSPVSEISVSDGIGKIIGMRKVNSSQAGDFDFDLSGQAPGLYYIKTVSNNGTKTYKMIIQK